MNLPSDCIIHTCSFIDSFNTLFHLRHTDSSLYQLSENDERYFEQLLNSDGMIMFSTKKASLAYFKHYVNDKNISKTITRFLSGVLDGGMRLMEQYGISNGRFVFDTYFECLIDCLCDNTRSEGTQLLLDALQKRSSMWNVLDEFGALYPRRTLLKMCSTLGKRQSGDLGRVLTIFHDHGIKLKAIRFILNDYEEQERQFASPVSVGFTLLHAALWAGDLDAIKTLVKLEFPIDFGDQMNRSILHYAVISNDEIAKYIINTTKQESIFLPDCTRVSPLYLAYLYNKKEILSRCEYYYSHEVIDDHIETQSKYRSEDHIEDIMDLENVEEEPYNHDDDKMYDSDYDPKELVHDLDQFTEYDQTRLNSEYKCGRDENWLEQDSYEAKYPQFPRKMIYGYDQEEAVEDFVAYNKEQTGDPDFDIDKDSVEDRDEEGLSSQWISNEELEDVIESTKPFETTNVKLEEENYLDVLRYNCTFNVTKVLSRTPIAESQKNESSENSANDPDTVNSNSKRLIQHDSEEPAAKKQKLGNTLDGLIHRRDLIIPKMQMNTLIRSILLEYFDASATPLAQFIIQDTVEKAMEKLFYYANIIADFYRKDSIDSIDLHLAFMLGTMQSNNTQYKPLGTSSLYYNGYGETAHSKEYPHKGYLWNAGLLSERSVLLDHFTFNAQLLEKEADEISSYSYSSQSSDEEEYESERTIDCNFPADKMSQ
jgi:hypothetical protein